MSLRRLALAAAALALIIGLWCAVWFYAAYQMRARIAAWTAAQQAAGNIVTYDALTVGGFPFRIVVAIDGPAYGTPTYRWQGASLSLAFQPWNLRRFGFRSAGAHRLDIAMGSKIETVHLSAAQVEGTGALDASGQLSALEGEFRTFSVAVEQGPVYSFANLRLAARVPENPIPKPDATVLEVAFAMEQVALPADQSILGPQIERAAGTLAFNGRLPAQPVVSALEAWRDGGGAIDFADASLQWGPLSVQGDGTLALDSALQPLAASSLRVAGFNETLDRLAAAGILASDVAGATKFALGLIAKNSGGGGPAVATVPVSIQNQQLFVGPVAVSRLQPIRWE